MFFPGVATSGQVDLRGEEEKQSKRGLGGVEGSQGAQGEVRSRVRAKFKRQ